VTAIYQHPEERLMMNALLLTHARQYVGPGVVPVVLREQHRLVCHDTGFADPDVARNFELAHAGAVALRGQTPDGISEELKERGLEIAAVISNDVFPNTPLPIEEVSLETLRQSVEALLIFPYRLTQLLLPPMKLARRGTFVFITSARYLQPEPGFSVATSVRAGTTAFALALAKEAAPFGIQVNVVGNFSESGGASRCRGMLTVIKSTACFRRHPISHLSCPRGHRRRKGCRGCCDRCPRVLTSLPPRMPN
jgi:3-oxoacyl-[acyl-carrier protein] reductase